MDRGRRFAGGGWRVLIMVAMLTAGIGGALDAEATSCTLALEDWEEYCCVEKVDEWSGTVKCTLTGDAREEMKDRELDEKWTAGDPFTIEGTRGEDNEDEEEYYLYLDLGLKDGTEPDEYTANVEFSAEYDDDTVCDGSITVEVTVLEIDFIVRDLWWFPSYRDNDHFPVTDAIFATGAPDDKGVFHWEITEGTGKVSLVHYGYQTTVTKTDIPHVNIASTARSDDPNDVTLKLTYTTSDGSCDCEVEKEFSVRTFRLKIGKRDRDEIPTGGWITERTMYAVDQWKNNLPNYYNNNVGSSNEAFSNHEDGLYDGENWHWNKPNGGVGLSWIDQVRMPDRTGLYPTPIGPEDSGASTPVDRVQQTWRYGSTTSGGGDVFMEGDLSLERNLGYAEHSHK